MLIAAIHKSANFIGARECKSDGVVGQAGLRGKHLMPAGGVLIKNVNWSLDEGAKKIHGFYPGRVVQRQ